MNPQSIRTVAVIDIGKTNAKVTLVDLESRSEIAVRKTPNKVGTGGPYPHHDVERLWEFMLGALAEPNRERLVDAISVTTHGATAALLDANGDLALPVLDYEHDGPDQSRADYAKVRPDFAETGSPRLPGGLNIGAQLFWQNRVFPEAFARATNILMYPQYWAWRMTGVLAGELTSLGCHTDLWAPRRSDYSSLVGRMGWREKFPPLRRASDVLGPILPKIAARTGLSPATPVACGIHDSNASLLPHLLGNQPPFTVVSTGTWVISMAVGGRAQKLDPARDTLINVNALGDPVPSARFMGGREFELLELSGAEVQPGDIDAVLDGGLMLLPSVQQGSGPFPNAKMTWIGDPSPPPGARRVAASFYLAMMTSTCLDLIGAGGPIIVEGPFAANAEFCAMLAAATQRPVVSQAGQVTGTSIGAALLFRPIGASPHAVALPIEPPAADPRLTAYAETWLGLCTESAGASQA